MPIKQYFVYIATNKLNTVLYTGVTNNLIRRMYEHRNKLVSSFASHYNIAKLVYPPSQKTVGDLSPVDKRVSASEGFRSSKEEKITRHAKQSVELHFEVFNDIKEAVAREKQIKAGSRKKKIDLIKKNNPNFEDLYCKIIQ